MTILYFDIETTEVSEFKKNIIEKVIMTTFCAID